MSKFCSIIGSKHSEDADYKVQGIGFRVCLVQKLQDNEAPSASDGATGPG